MFGENEHGFEIGYNVNCHLTTLPQIRRYETFRSSAQEAHLPLIPFCDGPSDRRILVVIPTYCTDDEKLRLEQSIKARLKQISSESSAAFAHRRGRRRRCTLTEPDTEGCSADIYQIAINAREKGWAQLLVVDPLAKSILIGTPLFVEDANDKDVVVVATDGPMARRRTRYPVWKVEDSEERGVTARRMRLSDAIRLLSSGEILALRKLYNHFTHTAKVFEAGVVLGDPSMPLFSSEENARTAVKQNKATIETALDSLLALPLELRQMVISEVAAEESLGKLSAAPAVETAISDHETVVYSLARCSQEELERIESELLDAASGQMTYKVHAWKDAAPCSRRDLARLVDRRICNNSFPEYPVVLAVYPEEWSRKKKLLAAKWSERKVLTWLKLNVAETLTWMKDYEDDTTNRGYDYETLISPWARLYTDRVPWLHRCTQKRGPIDVGHYFLLTNKLTSHERAFIERELRRSEDLDSPDATTETYSFIEWEGGATDGTIDNVWEILALVVNNHGARECHEPLMFADQQSAKDATILLVCPVISLYKNGEEDEEEEKPRLLAEMGMEFKGLVYTRVPARKAFSSWKLIHSEKDGFERVMEANEEAWFDEYTHPAYTRLGWDSDDLLHEWICSVM